MEFLDIDAFNFMIDYLDIEFITLIKNLNKHFFSFLENRVILTFLSNKFDLIPSLNFIELTDKYHYKYLTNRCEKYHNNINCLKYYSSINNEKKVIEFYEKIEEKDKYSILYFICKKHSIDIAFFTDKICETLDKEHYMYAIARNIKDLLSVINNYGFVEESIFFWICGVARSGNKKLVKYLFLLFYRISLSDTYDEFNDFRGFVLVMSLEHSARGGNLDVFNLILLEIKRTRNKNFNVNWVNVAKNACRSGNKEILIICINEYPQIKYNINIYSHTLKGGNLDLFKYVESVFKFLCPWGKKEIKNSIKKMSWKTISFMEKELEKKYGYNTFYDIQLKFAKKTGNKYIIEYFENKPVIINHYLENSYEKNKTIKSPKQSNIIKMEDGFFAIRKPKYIF